jgi:hypothetical protein
VSTKATAAVPETERLAAAVRLLECWPAGPDTDAAIWAWMREPEQRALALAVGERLDALPTDTAVAAATAALRGPHASALRPRIAAAEDPAVRAVLGVFLDE